VRLPGLPARVLILAATLGLLAVSGCSSRPAGEVRIPRGAGGVGFLPLLVMEKHGLIEKYAGEAGVTGLTVRWLDLGGPSVLNDALLSGASDYIAAGPPAFLPLGSGPPPRRGCPGWPAVPAWR